MAEKPIKIFDTLEGRYPEAEDPDVIHAAVKIALSAIPVLGSQVSELFSMVVTPSLERRRDDWFREVAGVVEQLRANGLKIEDLVGNELFVSAVTQTARIAIGTHQQEKRDMLRNALLTIAVGKGPQEDLQEVFLGAIDALSPLHMKVLRFLWTGLRELTEAGILDPLRQYSLGNYGVAIGELYPEMKGQENLLLYLMTDLKNRGFSIVARPADAFPQCPGVTNMGVEFLRFVLEPPK
jgi:hypothetical protein